MEVPPDSLQREEVSKNDLGRRSPWWGGRKEGTSDLKHSWSQFLVGFIHPVWWHPPDDGRQCLVVAAAERLPACNSGWSAHPSQPAVRPLQSSSSLQLRALRDEEVGGPPPNCLSWEALAGEEEPGGREEKRTDGEERRVFKKKALRRGTSFKNSYMAWRRLFRK